MVEAHSSSQRLSSARRSSSRRISTRMSIARGPSNQTSSTATKSVGDSALTWLGFFIPTKDNWFHGFNTEGKDLVRYFSVRAPNGEDINAWVPEGCNAGSEVLIKIGTRLTRGVASAGRTPAKKMPYRILTWTQLHTLCVERGLKPFGSRSFLAKRLEVLDNDVKVRYSMAAGPMLRLMNSKAQNVISVETLALVNCPRAHRSLSSLTRLSYDDLFLLCQRYELTDRRIPRKFLTARLLHTARMLTDDEFKDLHARYNADEIKALVEAPTAAPPSSMSHSTHRSELTRGSSRAGGMSFADIDADSNGTISAEELQIALSRDGEVEFRLRTCQRLIGMVDVDNDGVIDRFEFPGLMRYLADWEEAFESYDVDGSESIDEQELKVAMEANGFFVSSGFFGLLVMHYDSTGDGSSLGLDAFIQMFTEFTFLTQVFVGHAPNHTISERARFTRDRLMDKCGGFVREPQLDLAFDANELKSKRGVAEFEYEAFLYACIMT